MVERKKTPKLTVVTPASSIANPHGAPSTLKQAGVNLWSSVMGEYQISDAGGLALLEQACAAVDGIAECRHEIERDGAMVRGKFGSRPHPLLARELSLRSFVCKTLERLGLNLEPLRSGPGRPGTYE